MVEIIFIRKEWKSLNIFMVILYSITKLLGIVSLSQLLKEESQFINLLL